MFFSRFSFLISLAFIFSLLAVVSRAQPLVTTPIQSCKGPEYKLVLNCTGSAFYEKHSDACTQYTVDPNVLCAEIPLFYSDNRKYQLVFFQPGNPEISAWSGGNSVLALTGYDPVASASDTTQCSFSDVLANMFVDLQTNLTNIAQTIMASPYRFMTYIDGVDVDAGINISCISPSAPPPPPYSPPPPTPPSGDGGLIYLCDPLATTIRVDGCHQNLPAYVPQVLCSDYVLTRDYIPSDCGGFPIFQSLNRSDVFMWYVDKSKTDGVLSYVLIGYGRSLCKFNDGILNMRLDDSTASLSWADRLKSNGFFYFDETTNADIDSGAVVECLSYRAVLASPPPPLPPPPVPPTPGAATKPPPPPATPSPSPPPPGGGNSTAFGGGRGTPPSTGALAGALVGSLGAVGAGLCVAWCAYTRAGAHGKRRNAHRVVRADITRQFLL